MRFLLHYLVSHHAFSIPSPAALCEVIDSSKFNQSGEDEGVAHGDEPVHGSGVGDLRQGVPCADTQSCHCENSSYTWKHTQADSQ